MVMSFVFFFSFLILQKYSNGILLEDPYYQYPYLYDTDSQYDYIDDEQFNETFNTWLLPTKLEIADPGLPVKFGNQYVPNIPNEYEDYQQEPLECIRASPEEMFSMVPEIQLEYSQMIQFIKNSTDSQNGWSDIISDYLYMDGFEGIIILAYNYGVEDYIGYTEQRQEITREEIAAFSFVPDELNVEVIGPIKHTAQGSSVQLLRNYYVETENGDQAMVQQIVPFRSSCQQVEFWLVDRIIVPPRVDLPAIIPKQMPELNRYVGGQTQKSGLYAGDVQIRTFQISYPLSDYTVMELDIMLDLEEIDQRNQQSFVPQSEE